MATYSGKAVSAPLKFVYAPNAQAFTGVLPDSTRRPLKTPRSGFLTGRSYETRASVITSVASRGGYVERGPHQTWFEHIHSVPTYFELGNILTTVVRTLELYNAYRRSSRLLVDFTNNADSGVSITDLPALAATIAIHNSLILHVQVTTQGPATLDGSLDFLFDTGTLSVPITASRVVAFPYEPETPIRELLDFKTNILQSADGSEQRIAVRKNPRQVFELELVIHDEDERRRLQTLLLGWQSQVFGVPVWWEARHLADAAASGGLTVSVDTLYGDFRVGGMAILWYDSLVYDILEIAALDSTSLTFSSAMTHDYEAGDTLVMPLRFAYTETVVERESQPVGQQSVRMRFTSVDNDKSIASTAGFSTHNGKVMLDEPNLMRGDTHPEYLEHQFTRIDNTTSPIYQVSDWAISRVVTRKGFLGNSLQRIWQVRQLVHALRGSQVSFYLPTFRADLIPVANLTASSYLLDIENIGYTAFVGGREPLKSIWIELTNGTILTRQVLSAAVVDSNTERLTVDVAWGSTVTPAEVSRISFLQLVRIADDKVVLDHAGFGQAEIFTNVMGVIR